MKEDLESLIHGELTEFVSSLKAADVKNITSMVAIGDQNPTVSEIIKTCDNNNLQYQNTWIIREDDGYYFLAYDHKVSLTEEDKLNWVERAFNNGHFAVIYNGMVDRGYMRVGFNSALLAKFHGKSPYKMFKNREFDTLVEYYSLHFRKHDGVID